MGEDGFRHISLKFNIEYILPMLSGHTPGLSRAKVPETGVDIVVSLALRFKTLKKLGAGIPFKAHGFIRAVWNFAR
jgi:hypothetical protein